MRWLLTGLLMVAVAVSAAPQVRVVGLFPNAAVLNVDGERKLVRVGQTGPQGVYVVSADSRSAVLRINGEQVVRTLEREYAHGGYAEPQKNSHILARGQGGHYWISGLVNGRSMTFLIDTGATSLALNSAHAQRLGIDYQRVGTPVMVSTAGGNEKAWGIRLNSVKIAGIEVLGVDATVLEGSFPVDALLGMSFLNRVSWREDQGNLILEARH